MNMDFLFLIDLCLFKLMNITQVCVMFSVFWSYWNCVGEEEHHVSNDSTIGVIVSWSSEYKINLLIWTKSGGYMSPSSSGMDTYVPTGFHQSTEFSSSC